MSIPAEVLKKVKLLEISTRKLVNNLFAGEYKTRFKGQGMTFSDFREYIPGDDVRSISWQLTARTGKPYVKVYEEERELTMILAVDVSGSTDFGTGKYFKGEIITHIAALLAFSANKNNDQVGLLLFSDQIEHFVPPQKGRGHIHRILRDLYYYRPKSHRTNISVPTKYLQGILKKRSTIFLISDFIDNSYEQSLRQLGKKHDVTACIVDDPAENSLPDAGFIEVHDPETGEIFTIDTSNAKIKNEYIKYLQKFKTERDKQLTKSQINVVRILNNENFADPLIEYFKKRR